jgi:hypothetical protein
VIEEVPGSRPDALVNAGIGGSAPAEEVSQPSPAAECAGKRFERDAEIIRITGANADKKVEYDRRAEKAKRQVMDVKERLSLTGFAELNRRSNEWKELPQPGSEPETAEAQEASVAEVIE